VPDLYACAPRGQDITAEFEKRYVREKRKNTSINKKNNRSLGLDHWMFPLAAEPSYRKFGGGLYVAEKHAGTRLIINTTTTNPKKLEKITKKCSSFMSLFMF